MKKRYQKFINHLPHHHLMILSWTVFNYEQNVYLSKNHKFAQEPSAWISVMKMK